MIETGTGENKSTIKFDKQAIYTFEAPVNESENAVVDDVFGNAETQETTEEKPVESENEEEKPAEDKTDGE